MSMSCYAVRGGPEGMVVESHGSCFGMFSSLYRNVPRDKEYDRRIYFNSPFLKTHALTYIRAFRKAFKDGFTFKRGPFDTVTVPLPGLKWFDGTKEDPKGFDQFGKWLVGAKQFPGYFEITPPEGVRCGEVYLFLKLFGKLAAYPCLSGNRLGRSFMRAHKQLGCWRKAVTAMGFNGCSGGYNYPFNISPWHSSGYSLDAVKGWLNGDKFVVKSCDTTPDREVLHGAAGYPGRLHGTSQQCFPDIAGSGGLRVNPGQLYEGPFEQRSKEPDLQWSINLVKKLAGN